MYIEEQENVLKNFKKNILVSASAGSGKTYIMIKYISKLICEKKVPVKNLLVLTFTKAAALEMKERLTRNLKEQGTDEFIIEQIDSLSISNISTIHSFCEKCLKKHSNILGLNENFVVADENVSQNIRQIAFEKSIKIFERNDAEEYIELISCFKNNKEKVKTILFELESLTNSVADKESFLKEQLENPKEYFEKAISYLFENFKKNLSKNLEEIEKLHVDEFLFSLKKSLLPVLQSSDIFQMTVGMKDFKFPFLPKRKEVGDEIVEQLATIKNSINKTVEKVLSLNLDDLETVEFQRLGSLEKILVDLFTVYENEEEKLKKMQNCLDFYDLEKYMKILSEKEDLFSGIEYVFVDEYQDTNKVQERIIKNVAKNSHFVAVGDIKQGIYGFRLASSEIFLQDLQNFQQNADSSVNFLQSNFRSNPKILNFVNEIFKVCMTKEICGVDYSKTSMLQGVKKFEDDGSKVVNIDLINENQTNEEEVLPYVYSVKEAKAEVGSQNLKQILDIKNSIMEVMSSTIFEDGNFRKCKYSDIAILSRKRDALFNNLETFLQQCGIPVLSNSRNLLLDEPEIKVLLNFLKLVLNPSDDIAMLCVLLSNLTDVELNSIVEEKNLSELSLCEIVMQDKNGKFAKLTKNLEKFERDYQIYGIEKSFLKLFNETNYRMFINLTPDYKKTNLFIDKFLNEISASGYDFDLPALINYFENVDCVVSSEPSVVEDSILLTTIHNSKGLEYPIVFLIGCDQSLKKSQSNEVLEINEEFGLALKYYDKENNNEIVTAKMRAIKEIESQKDFMEEMFIFYVALTRPKNRLYLFGQFKDSQFNKFSVADCDSYFDLIFFSLQKQYKILFENDIYENDDLRIRVVDEVVEEYINKIENFENNEKKPNILEKIKDYLEFQYKFDDNLNFRLKESVTSLNNKNQEDSLIKYSNDSFLFTNASVETGNAYHFALKTLNFDLINNKDDLISEVKHNNETFVSILKYLDFDILYKNIEILKKFTQNGRIFKEKEFIMKDKIGNLLPNERFDDEILVQGIVDLFIVKENEIILIDYKYTNSNNYEYLINKYKNQLNLYKIALENSFKKPVKCAYLLSLKFNKLIKVEL